MDYTKLIPQDIINLTRDYFETKEIIKARGLNEDHKINISFHKPRTAGGFIISGILLEETQQSARCTYKEDIKVVTSSCTCMTWNKEDHCHHIAALYMKYLLINYFKEKYEDSGDESLKMSINFNGVGVHTSKYNTVITSPKQLQGAPINSSYSSLQYILTTKKVVNLPIPKEFKGKVKMNLAQANTLEKYAHSGLPDNLFTPYFSFYEEDGSLCDEVSLFEYLYLFNWTTGDAYHQPEVLKDFIKTLKIKNFILPINEYIRLTKDLRNRELLELSINNELVSFDDIQEAQCKIRILKSERKNYLEVIINLLDGEVAVPLHNIFKLFCIENGYLGSFRTKNESVEFIKHLKNSCIESDGFYKRHTHNSKEKDMIVAWGDLLIKEEYSITYSTDLKKLYKIENKKVKAILKCIVECFNETAVRYSGIDTQGKELFFQTPKNVVFEGISKFYLELSQYDIPIFYNQQKVKTWSNNIKFERDTTGLDWFNLTLNINEQDLDIIRKAEISEEYLVSNDSLILLTQEQKDILKFMQRYTKYEKISTDESNNMNKFGLSFNRARIFELFELKKLGIEGALTDDEVQLCKNLQNMDEMPSYPIPGNFAEIARPYQITGYQWLRFLYENGFGACLADDMGLGKTIQTIMFLESIIDKVQNVLIVCPVSILLNWKNEIEKFSSLETNIYYGDTREIKPECKIMLTSFGIMKKEATNKFSDINFDIVIMDEVQHLKNIKSLGANAARTLKAKFRICLTGTPVENDLSEFYNIMDLAIPGVWGELSFIRSSSSKKNRLLAKKTVKPFILRRRKKEVLTELPDKIEQYVYLNFSEEEKSTYDNRLIQIREQIKSQTTRKKYGEILKNLLELRQLCLWQKNGMNSTKIEFLMETLEQIISEGHKVLIFSQFTTYLNHIQNAIDKFQWNHCRIDGSMNMKKRQKEVDEFQEGETQIFLISLKAGGVGLNLTAANYIFLMDPWWNPAVENQAIDRAHRIGQLNKITVYRPIIKDTVEEKVLVLQDTKRELFTDLLDSDDDFFNGKLSSIDFSSLLT
jgi:SNF2 family DNA or RNA helicase